MRAFQISMSIALLMIACGARAAVSAEIPMAYPEKAGGPVAAAAPTAAVVQAPTAPAPAAAPAPTTVTAQAAPVPAPVLPAPQLVRATVQAPIQAPVQTPPAATLPQTTVMLVPVKVIYVTENQPVQIVDAQGRLVQVIYLKRRAGL